uniref:Uncharacterized protein n=1 Tax=Utricularia reniformis TaxID=192314 RepID=A0A1Y0B352_9LAMI|nr:hypothetical protein AEK19_MT1656 [Utricularia reniformis]ART31840.1 hypothetical protein AEK19_MT1656 [Utricularia reniformis]
MAKILLFPPPSFFHYSNPTEMNSQFWMGRRVLPKRLRLSFLAGRRKGFEGRARLPVFIKHSVPSHMLGIAFRR